MYISTLALSWLSIGFWWCVGSFVLGAGIGWLVWRNTDREAGNLELENGKAQEGVERREQILASNQELLASLVDPESNT